MSQRNETFEERSAVYKPWSQLHAPNCKCGQYTPPEEDLVVKDHVRHVDFLFRFPEGKDFKAFDARWWKYVQFQLVNKPEFFDGNDVLIRKDSTTLRLELRNIKDPSAVNVRSSWYLISIGLKLNDCGTFEDPKLGVEVLEVEIEPRECHIDRSKTVRLSPPPHFNVEGAKFVSAFPTSDDLEDEENALKSTFLRTCVR